MSTQSVLERNNRADEWLRRQEEERTERLSVMIRSITELERRLVTVHPDWDIQRQIHLDYMSLEVAADQKADPVIVECRRAEGWEWRGWDAVEFTLASCPVITKPEFMIADCPVIATPEFFEAPSEYMNESPPLEMEESGRELGLMDLVVAVVERETSARACLVA